MPKYNYTAKDISGKSVSGNIVANNPNEVVIKIQQQNLIPVTISEVTEKSGGGSLYDRLNEKMLALQKSVPFKDVVFFTRQMVTFLNAGVSITKSLKNIAEAQKSLVFKRMLLDIYEDINSGTDFSSALAKHPTVFSSMYVNIVRAGEATGKMDQSLEQLATYMEKTKEMKDAIKSAMMYPKFVLGFTAIIVFVILWKVIPVFESLFSSLGGELPLPTRMLIIGSDFIQNNFLLMLLILVCIFFGVKFSFKAKPVRNLWDKFTINAPVFGSLVRMIILSRLTSTLALLLSSGTAIIQALEISGKVASNNEYETAMIKATNEVKNGIETSVAMRKTNRFPDAMLQLIETGEETGRIDELMSKIAKMYDDEVAIKIKGFSSLIEPLLIVIMGVVIGGIIVAIYLPIFTMGQHFG